MTKIKYGRLTIVGEAGLSGKKHECVCDCGKTTYVTLCSLRTGNTKSCGCLRRDAVSAMFFKHGKKGTPEYTTWLNMRDRCNNPNNAKFSYYGGKGISVSSEWDDFLAFLSDMGERPTSTHTIDRIDSDGNYRKENCKWSTRKEQARNRSNTKKMTINNIEKPLAEWADIYGMPYNVVNKRIWRGWDWLDALTRPMRITGEKS